MIEGILYTAFGILTILAGVSARQLRYAFKHFAPPPLPHQKQSEDELPSVSVCIPARNEHHVMTDCLEAVLHSDYPKLEVIVLDDVSGDDTSALIKSFASQGVRFVQGSALPKGWLGKNNALQRLLDEASGTYVLFMDVDTRLEPHSIRSLVSYMAGEKVSMVSCLPMRDDGLRASVVLSPLRYYWELLFHRRLGPATASNAWMIQRTVLMKTFQGFHAFKAAVQPETKIATELAQKGKYRFIMSTPELGISFQKKWSSQVQTSTRLIFPIFRKQVALCIIAALDLVLLFVPFAVLLAAPAVLISVPLFLYAVVLAASYMALYALYTHRVWRTGWLLGGVLWPYLVVQELVLVVLSVVRYKRNRIVWKGRTIHPQAQS